MITYVTTLPETIILAGCIVCNQTPEQYIAAGYALKTQEMIEADRLAAEQAAEAVPFEISKIKLIEIFEWMGLRDTFLAFIDGDDDLKIYWTNSTTLDSNNPKLIAASRAIGEAFSLSTEQVTDLLSRARK